MTIVAGLLAALIGISLGLFGAGGAVLSLPVFVYVLHVSPEAAVPMSFLVIGVASLMGAGYRWLAGRLNPRRGFMFGLASMAGAFVGARIGLFVPPRIRLSLFAIAVVVSAVSLLHSAGQTRSPHTSRPAVQYLVFAFTGILTGIISIGGGVIYVPALVLLCGVPVIEATGISLLLIAMNAAAAIAGHVGQVEIAWRLVLVFTAIVTVTTLAAGVVAPKIPVQSFKRGFAVMLMAVGVFVLYRNLV